MIGFASHPALAATKGLEMRPMLVVLFAVLAGTAGCNDIDSTAADDRYAIAVSASGSFRLDEQTGEVCALMPNPDTGSLPEPRRRPPIGLDITPQTWTSS